MLENVDAQVRPDYSRRGDPARAWVESIARNPRTTEANSFGIRLMMALHRSLVQLLRKPVSGQSLAVVRIGFGLVMALKSLRLLGIWGSNEALSQYQESAFHFHYGGFGWLPVLPQPWLDLVGAGLLVCSVLLMLGIRPRIAAAGVCLTWTYVFLIAPSNYNNHYYLQSLLAFLLIWMPTDARFAIGARKPSTPSVVPFACVFLLRFQLVIVYFFGGVAKLNYDYLVRGEPMASFLDGSRLAEWCPWILEPAWVSVTAYSGLLFDLAIGPLLLLRQTRSVAFALVVAFHACNEYLLFGDIGLFPWLALVSTTIFFAPDWPEALYRRFRPHALPAPSQPATNDTNMSAFRVTSVWFVYAWILYQSLAPFRPYLVPGNAAWTGQGHFFSWRMKTKAIGLEAFRISLTTKTPLDSIPRISIQRDWDGIERNRWVVIAEPTVGARYLWISDSPATMDTAPQPPTGVLATVVRARPASDCLKSALANFSENDPQQKARLESAVRIAEEVESGKRKGNWPKRFHDGIARLAADPVLGDLLRAEIRSAAPGALRGAPVDLTVWIAVPEISDIDMQETIHVHEQALEDGYWHELPTAVHVEFPDGKEYQVWNGFAELSERQLAKMIYRPEFSWQYAQHIAQRCERQYGQRPKVHFLCRFSLNARPSQSLIDPRVDLAGVPYRTWQPNEWVLPLAPISAESVAR